ncbi:MAG: tRNA (adenosine(37)-N6)-threonylcarbamoyltransferase complex dimerization subunit type 1 TsaB [Elusimicrobia bacterium]|nr:tRNA (adenosine(37)-N6)-threonylcarbamoyltransferase complex dimerization subunit type 1 TsaB [Elusimicrobiota bacterium]
MRPKLLAFDTTADRLTLALDDGRTVRARLARAGVEQDELLTPEAERLLRAAKLELADLDAFVAATGPGRFTGIRVGLTFAGVLARALGKRAVGVSWLEACAWRAAPTPGRVVAVLPGWKGELFFQAFERLATTVRPLEAPRWCVPEDFARTLGPRLGSGEFRLVGPAAGKALALAPAARLAEVDDRPLAAADLLAPARERLEAGRTEALEPLYIKPAHYER